MDVCGRHERDADDLILQAILEIRSSLAVDDWKESLEADLDDDWGIDPCKARLRNAFGTLFWVMFQQCSNSVPMFKPDQT